MNPVFQLQASPEFKGIKTVKLSWLFCNKLQASPEFKGIKTRPAARRAVSPRFKPALNSKGLRRARRAPKPDTATLQASPEFKGIKTPCACPQCRVPCFKPALNSKGLRPNRNASTWNIFRFKPALNSKGLRPSKAAAVAIAVMLQASPEFKGIKT